MSDKHLGRSAAHFLEHTVSCLMSGIGVHCMALNMAMVTISFEGAITDDERAGTSPAKSSKIPFCGTAEACRKTGEDRQRKHDSGRRRLLSGWSLGPH